ncbi:MAG TPA: AMP-binding protein [Ktedonobacteraceae bacterium]|jgi:fatty-acyl-CoA synthase|nr:AMP-binding protein [Ktedonobacteraceae bacterium]
MGMTNDGLSYWQAETDGESLLEITIGDLLDLRAQEYPTKEALVYSGYPEFGGALDIRWSYVEYRERVNAVARGLMALGLNKGEHIAIWAANLPEWPLIQLAAAKIGLVLVTINPLLRGAELEYILKQGDVAALFFMAQIRDHDCLATIRSLTTPGTKNGEVTGERLPNLRYVSLLGAPPQGLLEQQEWRPTMFREMVAGSAQISAEALKERQASVTPDDPVMILYTSGTTGFPKGAVLSHLAVINIGWIGGKRLGFDQDLRGCVIVPFFHVFGCVGFVVAALSQGGTIYPLIAFDPLKALQIISSERCTYTGGVPTMFLAMLQHPDFDKYDLSSLKMILCGGAPVPVALMEAVKERMGADVAITFGQTESTGGFTLTFPEDPFELKAATVGVPQPYVDVKIIDPATGQVVPCGERGEICCRGYLVMQGYYNMPEKTAEVIDADGWLHTGDLATMDARGYVNIVGRLKEMVIRGGENIFPREIEEFLIRHPKIADVQVLGVPDKFYGEELLAVVLPREGVELTEEELREYCKGRISSQKIPRYFQFVTSYPMTGSGKVQKFVLRENAIKMLGLEEARNIRTA